MGQADTSLPAGLPAWRPGLRQARAWAPGLLLCGVIALAAAFIEMRLGGPRVLYALLLGMAFHEFSAARRQQPGVDLSARTLLRLGIGLLGAGMTLDQVSALGAPVAALIVLAVATTLALVAGCVRALRLPWRLGLIAGGATAICGAAAALAIAAALPRDRDIDAKTVAVVVCATTLSTLAMLLYPLLCTALALPPALAGLFLGGSIHDVAQVAVAGYALGAPVGETAVIVKLMRVALLTAVVLAIGVAASRRLPPAVDAAPRAGAAPLVPWFLQLFVACMLLQSLHALPQAATAALSALSQACLVMAAAAIGMRSTLSLLRQAGWRILLPMALGSVWLAALTLGGGWLLGVPGAR
jgi:uncharacterized integral membrane protein (TIGR00698 family)